MVTPHELFLSAALAIVPRILTLTCRTPSMRGYGSCDREWWNTAQRTMSLPRRQEAVLSLALAYTLPGQPYYGREDLPAIIAATLDFWCGLQHRDGAFDDLYANERAHVAAAFGTYAVAETLESMRDRLMQHASWPRWLDSVRRACKWLCTHSDTTVANHQIGACAALQAASVVLRDAHWSSTAANLMHDVLRLQSREGWFPEYGGADTGYLSLSLGYLAKYHQRGGLEPVIPAARSACAFLARLIMPDGSCGGEYCCRNTSYLLAHGPAVFAGSCPEAAQVLATIARSYLTGTAVKPAYYDDHNCMGYGYDMWLAARETRGMKDIAVTSIADEDEYVWRAEEAGIVVVRTPTGKVVINCRKGGAYVYGTSHHRWENAGVVVDLGNGRFMTSCSPAITAPVSGESNVASVPDDVALATTRVVVPLVYAKQNLLTPFKALALMTVSVVLGWLPWCAERVKAVLRRLVVTPHRDSGYILRREILCWRDGRLTVRDRLTLPPHWRRVVVAPLADNRYGETSRCSSDTALPAPLVLDRADFPCATELAVVIVVSVEGEVSIEARPDGGSRERI